MHVFRICVARIYAHDTQKVRKGTKKISYTQKKNKKFHFFHPSSFIFQLFFVPLQPFLWQQTHRISVGTSSSAAGRIWQSPSSPRCCWSSDLSSRFKRTRASSMCAVSRWTRRLLSSRRPSWTRTHLPSPTPCPSKVCSTATGRCCAAASCASSVSSVGKDGSGSPSSPPSSRARTI